MDRTSVLAVLHCYYNRAGTEQHVRDLARALAAEVDMWLLFRHGGDIVLRSPGGDETRWVGERVDWPVTPYMTDTTERVVREVLERVRPQVIHVHHIHQWPLGVLDHLTAHGVPTVYTLHDYYLATPYFTGQGSARSVDSISPEYSQRMFGQDISAYLEKRRAMLKESVMKLRMLIAPSAYVAHEFAEVFPGCSPKVIEHGIAPFTPLPRKHPHLLCGEKLRFGYMGSLLPQKGWEVAARAFVKVRERHPGISLDFFGGVAPVRDAEAHGITFHGPYEQDEIATVAAHIEVAVIPSLFPETYCLTLSELWRAGVPTIASDIGALGERIQHGVNGALAPPGDVRALAEVMEQCVVRDDWQQWSIVAPRTVDAMAADYRALYENC